MNTDPFEQRLARQPLRNVPAEWREEMLAPAHASQLSTFSLQLREWLWPCPQAWAALAAAWVLLLAVNFAGDSKTANSAQMAAKISPEEMRYAWREQQRLLAELFPPEPVEPPRHRAQPAPPLPPGPRSELRLTGRREEEIA